MRPLKVFLSHAHADATRVRTLHNRLVADGVDAWLDKEKLIPGQDWEREIRKAVREADVVIVCLSKQFNKAGYRQKEVRWAIDAAMEKPDGEIFIIPARLEECDAPDNLQKWHWVDLFEDGGYEKIAKALSLRAENLDAIPLRKAKSEQVQQEFGSIDLVGQIGVLANLGVTHVKLGNFAKAIEHLQQALSLSQKIGDRRSEISVLLNLASAYENIGDLIKALELYESALDVSNSIGWDLGATKAENHQVQTTSVSKPASSKKRKSIKTEYIVAIIGATATIIAGILGSPLIGKWLELVPTSTPTQVVVSSTANIPTPMPAFTPTLLPDSIIDDFGVGMVLVSKGEFTMGSNDGDKDESPMHQVYLDAFYIDKYEVTNTLYKTCVEAGICQEPTDTTYYRSTSASQKPVVYVSWEMAKSYCEWRGTRLPTEAEWEKAARGTDSRIYPWGTGIDCRKANYGSCFGSMRVVGVDVYSPSPYGAFDMAGNVWEWTADWYAESYYQRSPSDNPRGPSNGDYHVIRGGGWESAGDDVRTSERGLADRAYYKYGFRCAKDAP